MAEIESPSPQKVIKRKFDKAIFLTFFTGVLLIVTAVALKSMNGDSQLGLVLAGSAILLTATVLMFMKSFFTGKKYAVGAKKRRKKYLTVMYGEGSVFAKSATK